MRKNVGCFLLETNSDQHKNLLSILNVVAKQPDINFNLFTLDYSVNLGTQKFFTILPVYEARYYFGKMFAFDMASLDLLLGFPNIEQIIYYQNDQYPWVNNPQLPNELFDRLFKNNKVKIITDGASVKKEMDSRFNQNCTLINIVNAENLYNVI